MLIVLCSVTQQYMKSTQNTSLTKLLSLPTEPRESQLWAMKSIKLKSKHGIIHLRNSNLRKELPFTQFTSQLPFFLPCFLSYKICHELNVFKRHAWVKRCSSDSNNIHLQWMWLSYSCWSAKEFPFDLVSATLIMTDSQAARIHARVRANCLATCVETWVGSLADSTMSLSVTIA